MAGDWIKIEHALPNKPEVMAMAEELNIPEMEVVGHLVCFWTWVDQNLSEECPAVSGTKKGLDRVAGRTGFAQAMVNVGWLKLENGLIEIPNYDEHLSQSAKARSVEAKRKRNQRSKMSRSVQDKNGTNSGTEKRREEYKTPQPPLEGGGCLKAWSGENISREQLGKHSEVLAWAKRNVPKGLSEDVRNKILACSVKARRIGRDPPKLFLKLVRIGLTQGVWQIEGQDEDRVSQIRRGEIE